MLVSCTLTAPRSWRLFFVVFLVRMWRLNAWPRLTVPPGRTRNRLAALFLVFILGMTAPFELHLQAPAKHLPSCWPAGASWCPGIHRGSRDAPVTDRGIETAKTLQARRPVGPTGVRGEPPLRLIASSGRA